MAAGTQFNAGAANLRKDGTLPDLTLFDFMLVNPYQTKRTKDEWNPLIDEAEAGDFAAVFDSLPGPWQATKTREDRIEFLNERSAGVHHGRDVFQFVQWQLEYGDAGLSSNIVAPLLGISGMAPNDTSKVKPRVIIADPADAERIARMHVRKDGNFEVVLFDGVISTTDNDSWRQQRAGLAEVFLPVSSLAQIMPVSLARAKLCAERLADSARGPDGAARPVDMSDFLLHEAQAQLQLALMGVPEEQMESTNTGIRAVFAGSPDTRPGTLADAAKELMNFARTDGNLALPSDGCPVRGPLFRALQTSEFTPTQDYGNMLLFLFAGHDTTGHTMTWLVFEMARNPEIQRALRAEMDAFFQFLGGRDPTYHDLGAGKLQLLDRCVTETLRLWPAVANGTFRQLQFADTIKGPGGSKVTLPKGTPVQIVNWSRHRNPALWGPDADEFNPHREFHEEEVARVGCPLAASSPQSERFSPFAHKPRNCLGRNFAQLEMRLILTNLFHKFEFSLASPFDQAVGAKLGPSPTEGEFRGVNRLGTMGPLDMQPHDHAGPRYALLMHATVRQQLA